MKHRGISKFRAIATAPAVALTLFFGWLTIVGITYPLIDHYMVGAVGIRLVEVWVLATAVLVGVVLAYSVGARYAFKSLDPKKYAEVALVGRPIQTLLPVLSSYIVDVCDSFLNVVGREPYEPPEQVELTETQSPVQTSTADPEYGAPINRMTRKLQKIALSGGDSATKATHYAKVDAEYRDDLELLIEKLGAYVRHMEQPIARIHAMKLVASSELGIRIHRLCDHLLQYSPAMQNERVRKYLSNCREMHASIKNGPESDQTERLDAIVRENGNIRLEAQKRVGIQNELVRYVDTYPYIQEMATTHSTTSALRQYANAIAEQAELHQPPIDGSPDQAEERIEGRLKFLHRKQRAHPGFDLTCALKRVCEERLRKEEDHDERKSQLKWQIEILTRLSEPPTNSETDTRLFRNEDDAAPNWYELSNYLTALTQLPRYLRREIDDSRRGIVEKFGEAYDGIVNARADGRRFIVTHGYSKTVRDVFRDGAYLRRKPLPQIFLLVTDSQERLDTQMMEYQLKGRPGSPGYRARRRKKYPFNIAAGDEEVLSGLLSETDTVIILLGAECFDEDRRVVHPRGLVGGVSGVKRRLSDRCACCVSVVVADGFKKQESLTDSRFYEDHFDRVAVYPPKDVDMIVSDQELLSEQVVAPSPKEQHEFP